MKGWPVLIVVLASAAAGCLIGAYAGNYKPSADNRSHGCAHYDAQSGDFTWNDEERKP